MKHPSITITGSILAADILNAIEQNDGIPGQNDKDFGLPAGEKVKDHIARVYADARFYWQGFKKQMERLDQQQLDLGTTETRKFWMIPFLSMLGYDPAFAQSAARVQDKTYPISHSDLELDQFPVHIVGYKDSLDDKVPGRYRMSPHAMLQEYLNLTEHLYGIVTNGLQLRLLRDSSRLIKLSYLEFDLERLFEEEHYADFALLFRLLHQSRMPRSQDTVADCLLEEYHQLALASGSRIRDGLSKAVEASIKLLGNGFLRHADNDELRRQVADGTLRAEDYYNWLLRLIYRMLFLMVIEERNLVYDKAADEQKRRIYYDYYSLQRLRQLSEHRFLADHRFHDYWQALRQTFRLFETEQYGAPLHLKPLAGGLFGYQAIGALNTASLDNATLLQVLRALNAFKHPDTGQKIRVNYGALNVEEFGSVYEGLLDYRPEFQSAAGQSPFELMAGDERSKSGSHYTPDELVAPLIEHSLEYVIRDKLEAAGWTVGTQHPEVRAKAERALLSITVCDVACGSGHILLNAARRIALQLALVQTGAEQSSPEAQRSAIREVIRHCIYGVDLNPLAVELCKVALWLEAHNPGEPLNFLDHHIKCGNAIVGAGRLEDLMAGIPNEAFQNLNDFSEEEKEVAAKLRKSNKKQREDRIKRRQLTTAAMQQAQDSLSRMAERLEAWEALPETSPGAIEQKAKAYRSLVNSAGWYRLKQLADIQAAQFFLPKRDTGDFVTDQEYNTWLYRNNAIQDRRAALAVGTAERKRFFHWFLEFPEVFVKGGFDCILGNPPFLGGQSLSGAFGPAFCEWIRYQFSPTGLSDLIVYFVRRFLQILKPDRFAAFISTNSITDGDIREDGLEQILKKGATINFAISNTKWPGQAKVIVSLVSFFSGSWERQKKMNGKNVDYISAFLEDYKELGSAYTLNRNQNLIYQGTIFLGEGFLLTPAEAKRVIDTDRKNSDVVLPVINGQQLSNEPKQIPQRWIINFFDWDLEKASKYKIPFEILEKEVKPYREKQKDKTARLYWWRHLRPRMELYSRLDDKGLCFAATITGKYLNFSACPTNIIFLNTINVFVDSDWNRYSVLQSSIHETWARKYSGSLKQDLRYSPRDCFETFPFPKRLGVEKEGTELDLKGANYHQYRKDLMENTQLGLTKTYNQFHNPQLLPEVEDLSSNDFKKRYGKESWNLYNHLEKKKAGRVSYAEAVPMIEELRRLHREMDEAVLAAYGWEDIQLRHDFYEVDYLPENDNIRYTIHPEARKEVLKRLLLLNHERYAEEVRAGLHGEKAKRELLKQEPKGAKERTKGDEAQGTLF